jgi:Flp pilus assembly protein TadD
VLAYSYRKSGRYREAVVLLKNLLKEDTRDVRLLLELAHCLDKSGSSSYAITLLKKSLPALPGSGEPALALGILLAREKKNEEALEAFREAAARSPKDPRPLRRMSALYRASGVAEFADRYEREAKLRERS